MPKLDHGSEGALETCFVEMLEVTLRRGELGTIRFVQEFLFGDDRIVRTLNRLARRLRSLGIHYAVTGDLACVIYGQASTMGQVEVLLTADGFDKVSRYLVDDGYVLAPDSKRAIIDQETSMKIHVVLTGEHPSHRATMVTYPKPAGREIEGVKYLNLSDLIEMKLAAGMAPAGMRHLGDVVDLIRARRLSAQFRELLNESVRGEYDRLWSAVQNTPEEH
jgi:hypothetical protein